MGNKQPRSEMVGVFILGRLTQLVEWLAVNQYVASSILAPSAKFTSLVLTDWAFFMAKI